MTPDAADLIPNYARSGVGVLPLHTAPGGLCSCGWSECPSAGKHPWLGVAHRKGDPVRGQCKGQCGRTGHGVHDATTDLGQIAEWLARWPGCNWGGEPPKGVVVIDVDPRNGGHRTLAEMQEATGPLPATLTARTGSGGRHLWFTYSGPSRGRIGQGIDVKKQGGYVVLPPSVHACGGTYQWTDQRPAVSAPRWLRLKLNPPARTPFPIDQRGNLDGLIKFVFTADEGQRNDRLYWACCRARETGLDTAALIDAAEAVGLTRPAAEATARSAANAAPRKAAG